MFLPGPARRAPAHSREAASWVAQGERYSASPGFRFYRIQPQRGGVGCMHIQRRPVGAEIWGTANPGFARVRAHPGLPNVAASRLKTADTTHYIMPGHFVTPNHVFSGFSFENPSFSPKMAHENTRDPHEFMQMAGGCVPCRRDVWRMYVCRHRRNCRVGRVRGQ